MVTTEYSNDNIFVIRYRILYYFYQKLFSNKYGVEIIDILEYEFGLSRQFLSSNVLYLRNSGYLGYMDPKTQLELGITFKGIRLIEEVTGGNLNYDIKDIRSDEASFIRRLFRERDSVEN